MRLDFVQNLPLRLEKRKTGESRLALLTLFGAVLLTRLPFLRPGYGLDADAWRLATSADQIARTGVYEASRLPGYPIPEMVYALVPWHTDWFFNLIAALFSALAVVEFARIASRLGAARPIVLALILTLTPLFYLNSTVTMDYIWAMAFILLSYRLLLDRRFAGAGIFLGVAVGCRLTSAIMVLPFLVSLMRVAPQPTAKRQACRFVLATVLVSAISFLPVFLRYGLSFFAFHESGYPGVVQILYRLTVEVWGLLGLLGLFLVSGSVLFAGRKTNSFLSIHTALFFVPTAVLVLILYLIAFLRLPHEAEYLLPALPFFLLLLDRLVPQQRMVFFAICMTLTPFFFGLHSSDVIPISPSPLHLTLKLGDGPVYVDVLKGPLPIQQEKRNQILITSERMLKNTSDLHKPALVISGWWHEYFMHFSEEELHPPQVRFQRTVEADELGRCLLSGVSLYFLPGQEKTQQRLTGIDLQRYGAVLYSGTRAQEQDPQPPDTHKSAAAGGDR
ncbi:MAG TPA: hypothetical protein PKW76_06300 [bacterium]|nr:hypothetical protein [bacterium]HPG45270.1 hypothetical protein [bacterium]HPM99011.1 hypothetical protein [bacterium]